MSEAATFINRGQQADAFGHLVLLLRDVRFDGEKEVYSIVFENEELDDAGTDEAARSIEERNKIRNLLHKAFKTIRVVCMPLPHADIDGTYSSSLNMTLHWVGLRHMLWSGEHVWQRSS